MGDLAYPDGSILLGDCRERLAELPAESVQCCVTSPPYFGLRRYAGLPDAVWGGEKDCQHEWGDEIPPDLKRGGSGTPHPGVNHTAHPNNRGTGQGRSCRHCQAWLGQLGNEPTIDLYLSHLLEVFRAVRRVLRRDGVSWVNLGDSYASTGACGGGSPVDARKPEYGRKGYESDAPRGRPNASESQQGRRLEAGIKPKELLLIPERFAIAMQADGWYVRSRIVWAKKSSMPESVTDRPTSAHETIWMLTKEARYFYDAEAVKQTNSVEPHAHGASKYANEYGSIRSAAADAAFREPDRAWSPNGGANLRNVWLDCPPDADLSDLWELGPAPFSGSHFATFVPKLVKRCVLASTSEKGCCSACGAPWRRVKETDDALARSRRGTFSYGSGGLETGKRFASATPGVTTQVRTLDWQPSCHCNAPIEHCVVLDPFLGSGTSAAVARSLGRCFVGIEASAEYVKLASKRIEAVSLALEERQQEAPMEMQLEMLAGG